MSDLEQLIEHARHFDNFEDFKKQFLIQIRHGQYWHVTDNPNFFIDIKRGPRDMSSMSNGKESAGKLMFTSDLEHWHSYYNYDRDENLNITRPYAVELDLTSVPMNEWHQVQRGFGNEFFSIDASKIKVKRILPIEDALIESEKYHDLLPHNEEELYELWENARNKIKESNYKNIFTLSKYEIGKIIHDYIN